MTSYNGFAQGENNVWAFGKYLGLDFNSTPPVVYMDSILAKEGSAAVCDKSGNLLFYCDGFFVYDRTHHVMPNGSGLLGNTSSTQGVAIASVPGYDSLYYLFTVDAYETWGGFKLLYNLVDMRLNKGLGDIRATHKNVLIDSLFSEKIAIAGSCGRNWLLVHKIDSPVFYAYDLSKTAPFASPVISKSGKSFGRFQYMVGEMKLSKNFQKIALINVNFGYSKNSIELHDFDQKTGRISNFQLLDSSDISGYGIEFSPDGKRLYMGQNPYYSPTPGIYQYDLSLGTLLAKRRSKQLITSMFSAYGLRLGPDNTIYCSISKLGSSSTNGLVGRIVQPNLLGAACTPKIDTFKGWSNPISKESYGFGNRFVPLYEVNKDTNFNTHHKNMCIGWPLIISGLAYDEYHWYDGDTSSRKTFTKPGTYWLRSMNNCMMNMDTFVITLQPSDSSFYLKKDTLVCLGSSFIELAPDTVDWYRWSDGDTAKSKKISSPSTLILFTSNNNCKIRFDTIHVKPIYPTYTYFKRDTIVCPLSTIVLPARPGSDRYLWFDGSTTGSKAIIALKGKYWVESQKDCDIIIDTFNVIESPSAISTTKNNLNICDENEISLFGMAGMDHYLWNTGEDTRSIKVSKSGKYWVKSAKDCVLNIDTFYTLQKKYSVTNLVKDTSICFSPVGVISVPLIYDSYFWNGGNKTRDTILTSSSIVSFYATNNKDCEQLNKQYNVSFVDFKVVTKDTFTCNDEIIELKPEVSMPNVQFHWNTGDTTASIKVNRPGSKTLRVTYKGCSLTDTINVDLKKIDLKIGTDSVLCQGGSLQLVSNINDALYNWSTGSDKQSIEVKQSGRYSLSISKDGCNAYQEVDIRFVNCTNCVAIPNAFTPNNDGINDSFKPILNCPVKMYQLQIFNRWGQEVYSAATVNEKWNGTTNQGEYLEGNVYFYLLKVRFEAQGEEEYLYKGDITLIR